MQQFLQCGAACCILHFQVMCQGSWQYCASGRASGCDAATSTAGRGWGSWMYVELISTNLCLAFITLETWFLPHFVPSVWGGLLSEHVPPPLTLTLLESHFPELILEKISQSSIDSLLLQETSENSKHEPPPPWSGWFGCYVCPFFPCRPWTMWTLRPRAGKVDEGEGQACFTDHPVERKNGKGVHPGA